MSTQDLDISNFITVTILGAQVGLGLENINTAALFTRETASPDISPFKIYTNATAVGTDFGTGSNAFKIATAFFGQQPNPLATNGYLVIISLTSAGAEKIEAAIARTINSVFYFGVLVDQILNGTDLANLATYAQTVDKMVFYASATKADFAPGGMLDLVRSGSESHTRCMYYSTGTAIDTQRFAAAYAGRGLSVDFTGVNTALTMHGKVLAGITPDQTLGQTDLVAANTAGVDVYGSFAGRPAIFTSGANQFFDEVYNELWFKNALQVAAFNFLTGTNTKIPQTEDGMEQFKGILRGVCRQAVQNGFLAPGSWTSATVFGPGTDLTRSISDVGFYIFSTPISQQSSSDRAARKAPTVQIAAKAAGAFHSANVIVTINL